MGLGTSGNGKIYVKVVSGQMAIRVSEGTPGAVSRVLQGGDSKGKLVHEQHYQFIDGKISGINVEVKSFGKFINIEIDNKYRLSIPWKSSMKRNIVSQMPNVNFASLVRIVAFSDKKNVKKNVVLIYQADEMVKFEYTKVNPNGLPEAVEKTVLGEKKLDYTAVEEFLYNALQTQIARFNEENGIAVEEVSEDDQEPSAEDF